jgi:hippurate hydrolase
MLSSAFRSHAEELAPDIAGLRHRLHRRPEIGLQLPGTQENPSSALDGLGLELSFGRSFTSVNGVLRRQDTGRAVLLRADMDALPVQERSGELHGDVVVMFQPGEEGRDGAGAMIEEGVLSAACPAVSAAFGMQVQSDGTLPPGCSPPAQGR